MPAAIAGIPAWKTLQNAATSGNGSSADITGAQRVLLFVRPSGTVTGGAITFEISRDEGVTWAEVASAAGQQADSAAATGSLSATVAWVYKIANISGPCKLRARISTNVTGGGNVSVYAIPVGQ